MRKVLAVLLAVLMLCGVFAVGASALNSDATLSELWYGWVYIGETDDE